VEQFKEDDKFYPLLLLDDELVQLLGSYYSPLQSVQTLISQARSFVAKQQAAAAAVAAVENDEEAGAVTTTAAANYQEPASTSFQEPENLDDVEMEDVQSERSLRRQNKPRVRVGSSRQQHDIDEDVEMGKPKRGPRSPIRKNPVAHQQAGNRSKRPVTRRQPEQDVLSSDTTESSDVSFDLKRPRLSIAQSQQVRPSHALLKPPSNSDASDSSDSDFQSSDESMKSPQSMSPLSSRASTPDSAGNHDQPRISTPVRARGLSSGAESPLEERALPEMPLLSWENSTEAEQQAAATLWRLIGLAPETNRLEKLQLCISTMTSSIRPKRKRSRDINLNSRKRVRGEDLVCGFLLPFSEYFSSNIPFLQFSNLPS